MKIINTSSRQPGKITNLVKQLKEKTNNLEDTLKAKEQELKISQHYNDELTKYITSIGELFNLTQKSTTLGRNCIEYYAVLSSTIGNQIKDLQSEFQSIQAEIESRENRIKELEEDIQGLKTNLLEKENCSPRYYQIVTHREVNESFRKFEYQKKQKEHYKQVLKKIEEIIDEVKDENT